MYPICYWWVSGKYLQPEPTMYSRCFCWFPSSLAPSVCGVEWLWQVDWTQVNNPVLLSLFCMGVLNWMGPNNHMHQATQAIWHSMAMQLCTFPQLLKLEYRVRKGSGMCWPFTNPFLQMDNVEREWRAHMTQIAHIDLENEQNCKEFQVMMNTIEEVILLNNRKFTREWEMTQKCIDCRANKHQWLKTLIIKLESLLGLQQTTLQHCQDMVVGLEERVEQLVVAVCKLESTICCCWDWLLSPGLHYMEGEGEEVVVGLEEEEDGLEYETKVPLTASYTTPPSMGGCSEPSLCLSHSLSPNGSDPEDNVALQTAEIEACVKAFLAKADEDLKLNDLPPLENVTPIPIHVLTIPGFIPFTVSTSQHCVPSKGLPQAYHPYQNSVGQCSCEAGGWCNDLPCSSWKQQLPQKVQGSSSTNGGSRLGQSCCGSLEEPFDNPRHLRSGHTTPHVLGFGSSELWAVGRGEGYWGCSSTRSSGQTRDRLFWGPGSQVDCVVVQQPMLGVGSLVYHYQLYCVLSFCCEHDEA